MAARRRWRPSHVWRRGRPASVVMVAVALGVSSGGALAAQPVGAPPALNGVVTTTSQPGPTTTGVTVVHGSTTSTRAPAPTTTSTTISPALIALSRSVKRTRPSNTAALLAALVPLQRLGFSPEQAAIIGMGQFPVGGSASYADDWLELRVGPPAKLHYGIDIVAAMGTPLRSPIDGILRYDTSDPTGYGLAAIVSAPDRSYYLMGHLSATVAGLATGSVVKQGQVVGFVGRSGDATGPHCHFEIHPLGGAGVDAKPILDRYQAEAVAAVPTLVAALRASLVTTTAVPAPVPFVPSDGLSSAAGVLAPTTGRGSHTSPGSLKWPAMVAVLALLVAGALATRQRRWSSGDEPKAQPAHQERVAEGVQLADQSGL